MNKHKLSERGKCKNIIPAIAFMAMLGLLYAAHEAVVFMGDDGWYMTNLVTGEPLKGFSDIVQSQLWHYNEWGGRTVTHAVLQAVLMSGEFWANILNMVMTILLAYVIVMIAGCKKWIWCFVSLTLLIFVNCNTRASMMWEAGCVNYVYSSVWILVFLFLYLEELEGKSHKPFGVCFWIVPLGLIAGWSNENMGPTAFLMSVLVTVYIAKKERRKPQAWMVEGSIASLAGSVLVICAPGNFVRSALVTYDSVWQKWHSVLYNFYTATFEFLFFSFFLLLVSAFLYAGVCRFELKKWHYAMYLAIILAHGAFLLSPTYPSRASFGILCLCTTVTVSMISEVMKVSRYKTPLFIAFAFCYSRAVFILLDVIAFPEIL